MLAFRQKESVIKLLLIVENSKETVSIFNFLHLLIRGLIKELEIGLAMFFYFDKKNLQLHYF